MLPFILKKIDRELLKQLDSKPNVSNEDQGYLSRLADIDARIKALNLSLKTARVESIPIITTAINDLHNERNKVSQGVSQVSQRERLQAAVERWEMLVEPLTIGIKTDNRGEDDPALDGLDIQDEIDRLFNITLARPSSVRNLLHSLDCKVECWFNPIPGSRSHVLDRGRLTCTIDGQITNNNNPGKLTVSLN